MASLSNAAKASSRLHRERHQPESRRSLGVLEKKKDYKLRANDFNNKQATIKKLRQKALDKNPDEFYFHMINSETKNGVHYEKPKDVYSAEQLKLMKSQDVNYLRMKRTAELKKIEKLRATLHMTDPSTKPSNKHTYFTSKKRHHKAAVDQPQTHGQSTETPSMSRSATKGYEELRKRTERLKLLNDLLEKMEQRATIEGKVRNERKR